MNLKSYMADVVELNLQEPASEAPGKVDAMLVAGPDGKPLAIDLTTGQVLKISDQGQFEPATAALTPEKPAAGFKYKPVEQKPVIVNSGSDHMVYQTPPVAPPSTALLAEGREAWDELVRYETGGPGVEPGEAREVFASNFARNPVFRKKQRDRRAAVALRQVTRPAPQPTRVEPGTVVVTRRRRRVDV